MKIGQYCQRQHCRHVELEQFWQAFASRGFVSDSWAFLLYGMIVVVARIQNPLSSQDELTQMLHGEINRSNVHSDVWHSTEWRFVWYSC